MTTTTLPLLVQVTGADPATIDADLLVLPLFEAEPIDPLSELDRATGGEIRRAVASGEMRGKLYELLVTPVTDEGWRARRIALVGAGPRDSMTPDVYRQLGAVVGLAARPRRLDRVALLLRGVTGLRAPFDGRLDAPECGRAATEGVVLSRFTVGSYKTEEPALAPVTALTVVLPGATASTIAAVETATARGRLLGECSNLARGLANEPGNTLTPREFATRSAAIAGEGGVQVELLDEHRLEALGMGLLLGVARGSHEPPRMIVMRYDPPGVTTGPVLGLVGKGVTFDTGGISLKPSDGMDRMKDDMAGGAAVVCAMRAIGLLKAPIRVVGIVPTAENMPGGRAIRPGDVLRGASGKTVEVLNTDAEGRLLLGDGLWYAQQLGATHLVDVATLTGAIVVALGKLTAGLFGTPPAWVEEVRRAADRAGDRVWPMPVVDEYRDQLKSEIADFSNTGGRPAGAITAALFLKEFTNGLPWAHLDIAGTAWSEESRPFQPKGPTGAAVRTLAELAMAAGEWGR
jgi:leucyl aminopeptidase